jgi:Dolichyl-phosphate-mannose-protein mannosyltransferase
VDRIASAAVSTAAAEWSGTMPRTVFVSQANEAASTRFAPSIVRKERKTPRLRRWWITLFAGIVLISSALRLVSLAQVPPFVDEDGYSTFAQNVGTVTWKEVVVQPEILARLTGDKPPLAILLQAWLNLLVGDIVVSGRLLSAIAGVATTILCFFLGRRLGGNGVGLVSMAAYACSPLAVLHERMVLQDPLMSAFSLGAILLAWTAMEHGSLRLAALSAALGAVSVQLKVSGLVTALLLLALVVAVDREHRKYWYLAAIGAAGVALSYISLIALPGSSSLQEQNQKLLAPLGFVGANLEVLRDAVTTYFPWGLPVVGVVGAITATRTNRRVGLVCILAVIAWAAPWVALSRFAPSRYYLAADPYACALIAFGTLWLVSQAARRGLAFQAAAGSVAAVVFAVSGVTSVRLATDFVAAPLSPLDDCQYRSCWPSGYAYRAMENFVAAAVPPGSSVAYMVDTDHRIALGLDRPSPPGVQSLGVVEPGADLPIVSPQPLYVVVDDVRDSDPGTGLGAFLAEYPHFTLVAQFLRPGSSGGVSIVSTS